MIKRIILGILFALIPIAAESTVAGQQDGVKNLSSSTRTYNLTNPTQTISIAPGATIVILDTQYQSSSAMKSDVTAGYLNEYVIGSPGVNTIYSVPVTINSSSNAQPALNISTQSGVQPGLEITQTNAGDIADFYQSQQDEVSIANTLLHVWTPVTFEQNLTIDNSQTVGGVIYFGSSGAQSVVYASASTGSGFTGYPANSFVMNGGPLSITSYNGLYFGTYQILNADNNASNIYLSSIGNNSSIEFSDNNHNNYAILNYANGLALGGSTYGTNSNVAGNLSVGGSFSVNTMTDTTLNTTYIVGNGNGVYIRAAASNNTVQILNAANNIINQQFFDNGQASLAQGSAVFTTNGNETLTGSIISPTENLTAAGQFDNVQMPYGEYVDAYNGGFKFENSAKTNTLFQVNENGTGSLANGNISWNNAGVLTASGFTISSGGSIGGNTSVNGTFTAGDIYAVRTSNTGDVFFGSSGTHSISYDGTNYDLPSGNMIVGGQIVGTSIQSLGQLVISPTGTATSGTSYASNPINFYDSTWNGSSAQQNNGSLYLTSAGVLTSTVPFNASSLNTSGTATVGSLSTSTISSSGVVTVNATGLNLSTGNLTLSSGGSLYSGSSYYGATASYVNGSATALNSFSTNIYTTNESVGGTSTLGTVNASGRINSQSFIHAGTSSIGFANPGDIVAEEGSSGVVWFGNGGAEMNYNGSSQIFGLTNALNVSGNISSVGGIFYGNGSGLTNIPSTAITGSIVKTLTAGSNIAITGAAATPTISLTGIVPVSNGGTGTSSPSLVAGNGVSINGTWPNQTVSLAGGATGTATAVHYQAGTVYFRERFNTVGHYVYPNIEPTSDDNNSPIGSFLGSMKLIGPFPNDSTEQATFAVEVTPGAGNQTLFVKYLTNANDSMVIVDGTIVYHGTFSDLSQTTNITLTDNSTVHQVVFQVATPNESNANLIANYNAWIPQSSTGGVDSSKIYYVGPGN